MEDRSLSRENLPPVLAPPTFSAEAIDARSALGLADVYACVRALSDAAVLCPLTCWRDTENGRVPLSGGRGPNLLRRPAPGVTQSALVAALVQNLATFGEAFLGKVRAEGEIVQLESLPAERMVVKLDRGEPVYTYFSPLDGPFDDLTTSDVVHIRGMLSPDGLRGASPIGLCREALGLNASLTTAASSLWKNGAIPAGILKLGSGTSETLQSLANAWRARHGGPAGVGNIAVVTGDVEFKSVSMPLADAQFIETRRLSTAEIARIMRVPVSVIGGSAGDSSTYRNAIAEAQQLVKFGLAPMLRLIEEAIGADTDLLPGETTGCSFDVDVVLLRADPATRYASYAMGLGAGFLTVDEVREREGLGPMPRDAVTVDPGAAKAAQQLAMATLRKGDTGE